MGQQILDQNVSLSDSSLGDEVPQGQLVHSGHAQILEDLTAYEKKEQRMLSQRVPEVVWLRVYHVTSMNKYLLEWLGFGFYHSSIELYNHEFAYGGHDFDFSGIVCVETNENPGHAAGGLELKERIPIGVSYYSMDEVDDVVIYFGNFWHG